MKTLPMITILLASTSLQMYAQMPQGPPPDPIAISIDQDRDRELSAQEISTAASTLLKLDKNKDNSISAEELRPEPPMGMSRHDLDDEEMPAPPTSALLAALDTDSSGDLSKAELAAASDSLLTLDADQDGKLSSEEADLTGPPEDGGGPPGGGGGPPPGGSF